MNRKFMIIAVFVFVAFLLALCRFFIIGGEQATRLSGVVTDARGGRVAGAVVRLQGTALSTRTNMAGRFLFFLEKGARAKHLTAWKSGFYICGREIVADRAEYEIVLNPIDQGDNKQYEWLTSFGGDARTRGESEGKPCGDCHPKIVEEWRNNAHSKSVRNELFLAFYNGVSMGDKGTLGYRADFPYSKGNCATCHVPAAALVNPYGTDPNAVEGVAAEGVFCDLCHKIRDASVDETGGRPGVLSYKFNRPAAGHQVFYGPLDDVFPGEDSYNGLYKKSEYCAPCHNAKFWDVPVYSDFDEWAASSYAERNIICQDCHMKPTGGMSSFAPEAEGGVERDPELLPSHRQLGINDVDFMRDSIEMTTVCERKNGRLEVSVTVGNTGAGHHYPTGNPMRNMILVVRVTDENGNVPLMLDGGVVPSWGGSGDAEDGNYAGLPGRGFARVLADRAPYPTANRSWDFPPVYPAPHWRPTTIKYDSRIPADGVDESRYAFDAHPGRVYNIRTKLVYRRTYKNWSNAMGIHVPELVLAENKCTMEREIP